MKRAHDVSAALIVCLGGTYRQIRTVGSVENAINKVLRGVRLAPHFLAGSFSPVNNNNRGVGSMMGGKKHHEDSRINERQKTNS